METKKFLKSLLSLALAVILTASLCVCGFSVSAAEDTVTVNVFDGTIAAPYSTGGSLAAYAGIEGILEGKTVASLSPQYVRSKDDYMIEVGTLPLQENAINYADAKSLALYVKNDLGEAIGWRMADRLEDPYHVCKISNGTAYWMVDMAENKAERYTITEEYINIPKDFEGYIVFDLTTFEDKDEFLSYNFANIFFWLKGITVDMLARDFYYGDMNISTASAEDFATEKAPKPASVIPEKFGTSPKVYGKLDWTTQLSATVVDSEHIGKVFDMTCALEDKWPEANAKIFTANDESASYKAIVFKFKFDAGVANPKGFTISTAENKTFSGGYLVGNWTTINLLNNKVYSTTERTDIRNLPIDAEGFEGYFILNIDEDTMITADVESNKKKSYADFIELYKNKDIYLHMVPTPGSSKDYYFDGTDCKFSLGEISVVNDVEKFIFANTSNEDVIFNPETDTLTNDNLTNETVDTTNIGKAQKFTLTTAGIKASSYTPSVKANENFKLYEAMVVKFKSTNGYLPHFVSDNNNYNVINGKYIIVNTITDEVQPQEIAVSGTKTYVPITDIPNFEGYIIIPTNEATFKISDADYDWAGAIDFLAAKRSYNLNIGLYNGKSQSGYFNDWQMGAISLVKDLDAFMAQFEPADDGNEGEGEGEGEGEVVDTNVNVIFDAANNNPDEVDNLTYSSKDTYNIGSTLKFAVADTAKGGTVMLQNGIAVDDIASSEAIVYSVKVLRKQNFPAFAILGDKYSYIHANFITVNTLNGEIRHFTENPGVNKIKFEDTDFEGYVIAPIEGMNVGQTASSKAPVADILEASAGKTTKAYLFSGKSENSYFNDWFIGNVALVNDIDAFLEKVTAPSTIKGDANLDGLSDVRDLVCMKKVSAGKDVKVNAFNVMSDVDVTVDGKLDTTDLAKVRKQLSGIANVTNDIGMIAWGLRDITKWDASVCSQYGAAKDVFNYGIASDLKCVKNNASQGAASWLRVPDLFTDTTSTVMKASAIENFENKISGIKQMGLWDDVVGFYTEELRTRATDEQYKALTKYLSNRYPGKRILAILSTYEVNGREADGDKAAITPASYDIYQYTTDIGYNLYDTIEKSRYEELNATLNANLEGLNFKKWYFPKTYANGIMLATENTQQFMIDHIELLYELLTEEENKGGLWLYSWVSYFDANGNYTDIGLEDLVSKYGYTALAEKVVEIGASIKALNN